jgi:hypothetical protein
MTALPVPADRRRRPFPIDADVQQAAEEFIRGVSLGDREFNLFNLRAGQRRLAGAFIKAHRQTLERVINYHQRHGFAAVAQVWREAIDTIDAELARGPGSRQRPARKRRSPAP